MSIVEQNTITSHIPIKDKVAFLKGIDLFEKLSEELLYKLVPTLKEIGIAKGITLIEEGEKDTSMFLLFEGKISIYKENYKLATIQTNSVIGELALLTNAPRFASAITETTCLLFELNQNDFFGVLGKSSEVTQNILNILIGRLNSQSNTTIELFKKREEELEKLVNQRTQELQEEKKKLEKALQEIQLKNEALTEANQKISAHRDEIALHNEQLTRSINYASRIQRAVVGNPSQMIKHMQRLGGDAMVFFKPKDRVSGDFHWFTYLENRSIFVVADCTGHGIPSAFMTMMGNALLDDMVNEKRIFNPSKILEELDKKILFTISGITFKQIIRDEMDIGILVLDHTENYLYFAGAKTNLLYVYDSKLKAYDIVKGSRHSIGGNKKETTKRFPTHKLSYAKGSAFYLATDGFSNQFGGKIKESHPWGEKYLKKNFRKFLASIAIYPMLKQKIMLEEELLAWQKEQTQTDDILVLGVKI